MLDPSCGEGLALATLGSWFNCPTYGNEISLERYEKAKLQLTKVVRGAAETLELRSKSWPFIFCNPPYNEGAPGERLEIEHTKQCLTWARNSGMVVFVLPQKILQSNKFWYPFIEKMSEYFVYEMIGRDFERFHQYIVIGLIASYHSTYGRYGDFAKADAIAETFCQEHPPYSPITEAPKIEKVISKGRISDTEIYISNRVPRAHEILSALADKYPDPFNTTKYTTLTEPPKELVHFRSMAPCRKTIVIQHAAAGAIRGANITFGDEMMRWVGSWRRYEVETTEQDDEGNCKTIKTEDIAYVLRGLNLRTGEYRVIDSALNQEGYRAFLDKHTGDLMNAVDQANPPRYKMDYSAWMSQFTQIHSPRILPGVPDGLFTAQKHVGAALLELFNDRVDGNKNGIIVGEMGTGKTATSAATMAINAGMLRQVPAKIVVMAPAIVAKKWCKEARAILSEVEGFKSFHIGAERKQKQVAPHRPDGIRDALLIQEYRGIQAKMNAGKMLEITDAEGKRFIELQGAVVVGTWTSASKRKKARDEGKVKHFPARKRALKSGTTCTYFGYRDYNKAIEGQSVQEHERLLALHNRGEKTIWSEWHIAQHGTILDPHYKPSFRKCRMPIKDIQEFMNYEGPALAAFSFEVGKNGAPWHHVAIPRRKKVSFRVKHESKDWRGEKQTTYTDVTKEMIVWHCMQCGQPLLDEESGRPWTMGTKKTDEFNLTTSSRVRRTCNNQVREWDEEAKEWVMRDCASPLYENEPFSYGGRWPIAKYLNAMHPGEYYFILDEAHNAKSGDSNIGAASHHLIRGSINTIAMTGTIFNGYARSLFYLLYRLSWRFRELYGFRDVEQFVQTHGLIETVTITSAESAKHTSAYGYTSDQRTYTREIPGASPELVTMMAPITVWLRLADVGIELPKRTEFVVPITMSESLQSYYRQVEIGKSVAIQAYNEGDRGPLSRWLWWALGGLDCPLNEQILGIGDVTGVSMPETGYAKDARLVNLVTTQLNNNRGVAIFVEQVNRRDPRDRIAALLAANGIHANILDVSTCAPDERMIVIEQWIEDAKKRGQPPVMIANGALVREGVDLLAYKTLVEVGQQFNVTMLRQRAARSHRIGQTEEVEIYYLYYEGTYQEDALSLIATKLAAMDQVDGEIPAGLAEFSMGENNFMAALLKSADAVKDRKPLSEMMQTAAFDQAVTLALEKKPSVTTAPRKRKRAPETNVPTAPMQYVRVPVKAHKGKTSQAEQLGFVF
jgi:superfamily II DNA or RNA helicase